MIIAGVYAYKKYQNKKKAKEIDAKNASIRHDKLISSVQYPVNDDSMQTPPNAISLQVDSPPVCATQPDSNHSMVSSQAENQHHSSVNPFEQQPSQPTPDRHPVSSGQSPTGFRPRLTSHSRDEDPRDPFRDPSQQTAQDPNSPTDSSSQYSRPESSRNSYCSNPGSSATPLSYFDSVPNSPPPYTPHELRDDDDQSRHPPWYPRRAAEQPAFPAPPRQNKSAGNGSGYPRSHRSRLKTHTYLT